MDFYEKLLGALCFIIIGKIVFLFVKIRRQFCYVWHFFFFFKYFLKSIIKLILYYHHFSLFPLQLILAKLLFPTPFRTLPERPEKVRSCCACRLNSPQNTGESIIYARLHSTILFNWTRYIRFTCVSICRNALCKKKKINK